MLQTLQNQKFAIKTITTIKMYFLFNQNKFYLMKHVFIISFFHDIKMFLFYQINLYSIKVVANAPVPVTTSTNIKLKCITYLLKQGLT